MYGHKHTSHDINKLGYNFLSRCTANIAGLSGTSAVLPHESYSIQCNNNTN